MKNILIVESPTKAKVISKYLDNNFIVIATKGHIRDIPKRILGLDLKNNFAPTFHFLPGRKKIAEYINKQASNADIIFLATDPDREGEAIGWHITQVVKSFKGKYKRLLLNEITPWYLQSELSDPKEVSMNMVRAQFARRIIDRLFGFMVSPYVSRYIKETGSAGRVQSPALRLIWERDLEIKNFKSENLLDVVAKFVWCDGKENLRVFTTSLKKFKNMEKFTYTDTLIEDIKQNIKNSNFHIESIQRSKSNILPPPPFNTPSLLIECSKKFKWPSFKTQKLAQILYEGVSLDGEYKSLITYPRTDSFRINEKFIQSVRDFINNSNLKEYVNLTLRRYKAQDKLAQDAHEAIRPVNINIQPEKIKGKVSLDIYKLYDLIYKRTIATQLKPSIFEKFKINIANQDNTLVFVGEYNYLVDNGYKIVYGMDEKIIPDYMKEIKAGEVIEIQAVEFNKIQTKPPLPYTEGGLIKKLKELGIGRPSTYAPILYLLLRRKHIKKVKGYLHITEKGIKTIEFLLQNFSGLIDYKFTEELESELDLVERGEKYYLEVIQSFYDNLRGFISLYKSNSRTKA